MSNTLVRRYGPNPYPWKQWLNGKQHTAIPGVDFDVEYGNFRKLLSDRAKKAGRKLVIKTKVEDGNVKEVAFRFARLPTESKS